MKRIKDLMLIHPPRLLLKRRLELGRGCWRNKLKPDSHMVSLFSNMTVLRKTKVGLKALFGVRRVLNI
jgi:hypothetical protein